MSPTERLDEYPEVFRRPDPMPWDSDAPVPVLWQFGERAGTPLTDFNSRALVRMRGEVERRNGKGSYFAPLIQAIDDELFSRGGL